MGARPSAYPLENLRSEPDFYWGNSPVNLKGQNPGGESFPTFPSGGYARYAHALDYTPRGGELWVLRVREHPLSMQVHPLTAKSTPSK